MQVAATGPLGVSSCTASPTDLPAHRGLGSWIEAAPEAAATTATAATTDPTDGASAAVAGNGATRRHCRCHCPLPLPLPPKRPLKMPPETPLLKLPSMPMNCSDSSKRIASPDRSMALGGECLADHGVEMFINEE